MKSIRFLRTECTLLSPGALGLFLAILQCKLVGYKASLPSLPVVSTQVGRSVSLGTNLRRVPDCSRGVSTWAQGTTVGTLS